MKLRKTLHVCLFGALLLQSSCLAMTGELGSPETVAKIGDNEITMGIHPDMAKGMESMIPLGRGATPEEAADAVYLFCIPESNYISGQIVLAGGGLII